MLSAPINGPACSLSYITACFPLVLSHCLVESQSYCTVRCPRGAPSGDQPSAYEAKILPWKADPLFDSPSSYYHHYYNKLKYMLRRHVDSAQTTDCSHCHFPEELGNKTEIYPHWKQNFISLRSAYEKTR